MADELCGSLNKLSINRHQTNTKQTNSCAHRICKGCNADYSKKSKNAFKVHEKQCAHLHDAQEIVLDSTKQRNRRKNILETSYCEYCNLSFNYLTVGQLSDHRYKCKNNLSHVNDTSYQSTYRSTIKDNIHFIINYPHISVEIKSSQMYLKEIAQQMRRIQNSNPNIPLDECMKMGYDRVCNKQRMSNR